MAAERLSALQKWILVKCYQKTIDRDNSGFTILHFFRSEHDELLPDNQPFYWQYIFRQEILADFFKLKTRYYWQGNCGLHAFNGDSAKEQVTLTRSLYHLVQKELIAITDKGGVMKRESRTSGHWINWQGIQLPDSGKEKAEGLKLIK